MVDKNPKEVSLKSKFTEKVVTLKRKQLKKTKRRVRRRRGKARYFKNLNKRRLNKRSEELCSAVEFVEINDMDWTPTQTFTQLPSEVLEWQKQDQMAYWKSRAISLEYENRMLKRHLRHVYAQTIEEIYDPYSLSGQSCESSGDPTGYQLENSNENAVRTREPKLNKGQIEVAPKFPELKNRLNEMEKIYGKKSQKILGMETALQLNYERYLEKTKPVSWPNLPLRMEFKD